MAQEADLLPAGRGTGTPPGGRGLDPGWNACRLDGRGGPSRLPREGHRLADAAFPATCPQASASESIPLAAPLSLFQWIGPLQIEQGFFRNVNHNLKPAFLLWLAD